MHIVQVTAEFAPIAKTGGLGEVLVGLSRELSRVGEKVEVILPKYDFIPRQKLHRFEADVPSFLVPERGHSIPNVMWKAEVENCSLRLLETAHPEKYFSRGKIYGFPDDTARFLYFSRAVLEYLKIKKEPIDVLHLHDWHVSTLAPLIRELHQSEINVRSIVLSIHNVEYQGKCAADDLEAIGLKKEHTERLRSADHRSQYNLLKGGIEYSDAIIPVSPSYANEILSSSHGFGLESALRKNKAKIRGILNGIDQHLWNPATDPHISTHYSASDSVEKIGSAKKGARKLLIDRFHLDGAKRPWIGAVTRLVPQKGPDLLEEALKQIIPLGGSFLLLGESPMPEIQSHFEALKGRYKDHPQVLLHLDYDENLAHQLYSALDFLLVPSLFEPCGLTQMIAMRYGTVPIVRATGGLKDTVFDIEDLSVPPARQNGFVFSEPTPNDLIITLQRVFQLWNTAPLVHQTLMHHGMHADFGWTRPAQEYLQVFKSLNKK